MIKFFNKTRQAAYWICFQENSLFDNVTYYLVNIHPNPKYTYASFQVFQSDRKINTVTKYLKLKKSIIKTPEIIPDINWLIAKNNKDERPPFKKSRLSNKICLLYKTSYDSQYHEEWIKKHVGNSIPHDICVPEPSERESKPINALAAAYIHNLKYGYPDGLVNVKDDDQHLYWFPFMYDYDTGYIQIYMINLHPKPQNLFGVFSKTTATDYSSEGTTKFKLIVNCPIKNRIIPNIEDLNDKNSDNDENSYNNNEGSYEENQASDNDENLYDENRDSDNANQDNVGLDDDIWTKYYYLRI